MSEHTYKMIELVGSSHTSIEEAVKNAVAKAALDEKSLRWFEVLETRGHIEDGKIDRRSGSVIITSSIGGLVGTPGMAHYVTSKHAVIGLTKTASGEVGRLGVRVNAVCPGPIDTRMIHAVEAMLSPNDPDGVGARYQASIPIGRYGKAEEVANTVLFLCSDLASNITGAQYVVDGGRTATGGAVSNPNIR